MDPERAKFLFNFISESDAIERIYNDPDVLMEQIEKEEKTGHVGAMILLESLSKRNVYLDSDMCGCHQNLVCHIQDLIVRNQHFLGANELPESEIGKWRKCGVSVGDEVCPDFSDIPELMADFFNKVNWFQENSRFQSETRNIEMIADFHYQFLKIHPFADGNGRTARAISCFLFRSCTLKPIIFENHDKYEEYYPCFEEQESLLMRRYFLEKYKKNTR